MDSTAVGSAFDALVGVAEFVVEQDDHGLAFDDGLAGGAGFFQGDLRGVVLGVLTDVEPLFEAEVLVLQGVDEFVGHDRLLHVGFDPVEQIDGFVVGVIPAFDLLLVEAEHVLAKIEVAGKQAELFERQGGAVEALAASLLLEAVLDVFGDLVAGGHLLFDRVQDGKAGALAGKRRISSMERNSSLASALETWCSSDSGAGACCAEASMASTSRSGTSRSSLRKSFTCTSWAKLTADEH